MKRFKLWRTAPTPVPLPTPPSLTETLIDRPFATPSRSRDVNVPAAPASLIPCHIQSSTVNTIVKIGLQVVLVGIFLSLFFFLYVVKVEQQVFVQQIDRVTDDLLNSLMQDVDTWVGPEQKAQWVVSLRAMVQNMNTTTSPSSYQSIRATNDEVLTKNRNAILYAVLGVLLIVLLLIFFQFCLELSKHMFENLIVLGGIALTEFLFLNLVTRSYQAADPNQVRHAFLQTLSDQMAQVRS